MTRHTNQVRGEQHHCAKLTESEVRRMRELHYDYEICIRCVAKLYGVKYPTAWDAIKFNTWRQVS